MLLALLDNTLDLLRTCASGDQKGVWHVDDDEIVDTEKRD